MNAATFRSFARTAIELQADHETPAEYTMIKAAVAAKYGLTKEAVSPKWIQARVNSSKNTTSRLEDFVHSMRSKMDDPGLTGRNWLDHDDAHTTAVAALHRRGVTKIAWNAGELAGLGILAAPAAANLSGRPMKEKHKDVAEVTGLGMLAAPYAHNIAANRSAGYAASGIGQRLTKAFSH